MKKIFLSLIIASMAIIVMISLLVLWSSKRDYIDDYSIIANFDVNSGKIAVQHRGQISTGILHGVTWELMSSHQRDKANSIINQAQRDVVIHKINSDGSVDIWYMLPAGEVHLNQQLNSILD